MFLQRHPRCFDAFFAECSRGAVLRRDGSVNQSEEGKVADLVRLEVEHLIFSTVGLIKMLPRGQMVVLQDSHSCSTYLIWFHNHPSQLCRQFTRLRCSLILRLIQSCWAIKQLVYLPLYPSEFDPTDVYRVPWLDTAEHIRCHGRGDVVVLNDGGPAYSQRKRFIDAVDSPEKIDLLLSNGLTVVFH